MSEQIEYTKIKNGRKFEIIAKKGSRNYPFDSKGKDRLFFIRLTELKTGLSIEWPYSHTQQKKLFGLVMKNVILDGVFFRELNKFKELIYKLEEERKNEI